MENYQKHPYCIRSKPGQGIPRGTTAKRQTFFCATLEEAFSLAGVPYPQCTPMSKDVMRFSTNQKGGDTAGWCYFFADNLGAAFGDWRQGTSFIWQKRDHGAARLDRLISRNSHQKEADAKRQAEQARHDAASNKATSILNNSFPVMTHDYLIKKRVAPHRIQAAVWQQGFRNPENGERDQLSDPALLIPMYDATGKLWSVAAIAPDGRKDFLWGGKKKGCFYRIGEVSDTVCIAEGYATAATIYEATGYAVFVAFDAGNMVPVAAAVRKAYPAVRIIVCADNDQQTPGNPGLTKGTEAARAVGGLVASPSFEKDAP